MERTDGPTLDRLAAHAAFARGVARALLRDEHAADDVLQDAWVAAIERPPGRNPRAWFATVARRLSLNRLRGARRRAAREAVSESPRGPRDEAASAADVAARREALRLVSEAVLALDEPHQTVVLLRFYDGLSPTEIAARLGVPAATVRTRLHRALAVLRGRLDASHGGRRERWSVVLGTLAGATDRPITPGAGTGATGGGGAWTPGALLGGLLVGKQAVVAGVAVLVLVAAGVWAGTRGAGSDGGGDDAASAAVGTSTAAARAARPRAAPPVVGTAGAAAAAETPAPPGGPARIVGRVVDAVTGAAIAGARVHVPADDRALRDLLSRTTAVAPDATSGADGRFTCAGLATGRRFVVVRASGHAELVRANVEASVGGDVGAAAREVVLAMGASRRIVVRVVAPPGVPPGAVRVTARAAYLRDPPWWDYADRAAAVAADGSFAIDDLAPGVYDVAASATSADGVEYGAFEPSVEAGGPPVVLALEDRTGERGEPLRFVLRVMGPDGTPVAQGAARRYILHVGGSSQAGDVTVRDGLVTLDATTTVGALWYEVVRATGADGRDLGVSPALVRLTPPDALEATVRLEPAASLDGFVRDTAGRGVAGVVVSASPLWESPPEGGFAPDAHATTRTDGDGRFHLPGLAPIDYAIDVETPPDLVGPRTPVRAAPGSTPVVTLRDAVRPVVTVTDAEGRPVPRADVSLYDGETWHRSGTTAEADGTVRFDRIDPSRRFGLRVDPYDEALGPAEIDDWAPADTTVHLGPALAVRGVVRGRGGAPVPGALVVLRGRGGDDDRDETTDDAGAFAFAQVPRGDVRLVVSVSGDDPGADAPTFAARAGDAALVLVVDAGCVLRVRIEDWNARRVSARPWFVEDGPDGAPGASHLGEHDVAGERLTFAGLPPGRTGTVVLGPFQDGFLVFEKGVRSDAGEVAAPLFRGRTYRGRVVLPDGAGPGGVAVTAEIPGRGARADVDLRGRWTLRGIPEGTWTVRAVAERGGRRLEASAPLAPGGGGTVLELR